MEDKKEILEHIGNSYELAQTLLRSFDYNFEHAEWFAIKHSIRVKKSHPYTSKLYGGAAEWLREKINENCNNRPTQSA